MGFRFRLALRTIANTPPCGKYELEPLKSMASRPTPVLNGPTPVIILYWCDLLSIGKVA